MFDPVSKTLVIEGPQGFDQVRWASDELYHGAPWIEFDIIPPKSAKTGSVPYDTDEAVPVSLTDRGTPSLPANGHWLDTLLLTAYKDG